VALDRWRFYVEQLCTRADCTGEGLNGAPLLWKNEDGAAVPGEGYGTCVLELRTPAENFNFLNSHLERLTENRAELNIDPA